MNIFKSAFSSGKSDESQKKIQAIFGNLKIWDANRATSLKNHL